MDDLLLVRVPGAASCMVQESGMLAIMLEHLNDNAAGDVSRLLQLTTVADQSYVHNLSTVHARCVC